MGPAFEFEPPLLWEVRPRLLRPRVADLERAVNDALAVSGILAAVAPGARVAITAGSRGIAALPVVLAAVVRAVRQRGAEPTVVAAMGSHGGGTPAGQEEVLASLGVTPGTVGCPVVTSADSVELGVTPDGLPVYCTRPFAHADQVLAVNRVKAHTAFRGAIASGLLKMLAVGVGGPAGARTVHAGGATEIERRIRSLAAALCARLPVLGGLGIVENGYDEVAVIEAAPAGGLTALDERLLGQAAGMLPQLPVAGADVLVVGCMGKEYSGTGLDPNVIGRWRVPGLPEPERPAVRRIVVLGLGPASHGNATGVGLADVITARLERAIDRRTTYLNCLTTGFLSRAMLPMVLETDAQAIGAALYSLGPARPGAGRLVLIHNTKQLEACWVSAAALDEARALGADVVAGPRRLEFDAAGNLSWPRLGLV